ncbi:6-carboxytetrahydropterin synthase [Acidocella sp.]|uniref:6-carboxytetrahydropterin synthase n=1 Tax=Acidocella sp. TaxID=50710 RepID=UPI00261B48DC|nr:6-carboxytetrahydropterin synthase [Acidocella sp.]
MYELSKQFIFDAAHTLDRKIDVESSRRIHGHTYLAEVTVRGVADSATGMVMDVGLLGRLLESTRDALDHRFLDEVPELGPATMENLCAWIWARLAPVCPALYRVAISRASSQDRCVYFGPETA